MENKLVQELAACRVKVSVQQWSMFFLVDKNSHGYSLYPRHFPSQQTRNERHERLAAMHVQIILNGYQAHTISFGFWGRGLQQERPTYTTIRIGPHSTAHSQDRRNSAH